MLVKVNSAAVVGVDGYLVGVEVDLGPGLQVFHIVGLPDGAVREARLRVPAAVENAGFEFPDDRITINLAPADQRKDGTAFDLPIAMGVLSAMGYLRRKSRRKIQEFVVVGELSLDGCVRPVRGVLPMAVMARDLGFAGVVVPCANAAEASLVSEIEVIGVNTLTEVVRYFNEELEIEPAVAELDDTAYAYSVDMSEVVGQPGAKRALEVAAAGGHNVLMMGPPGSGKSMLARRLPTILPAMSLEESLETTKVFSVSGLGGGLIRQRPFRAPHHTVSSVGLVGGGSGVPRPGEVSLAHHGVLFLDELPEFGRSALEVLRQPLEDGFVAIRRSSCSVVYPSQMMLVGAMNPCPCGYAGQGDFKRCRCSPDRIETYLARVSGPLMDRFDMHLRVGAVPIQRLTEPRNEESSECIRVRVEAARQRQHERFLGHDTIHSNAHMTPAVQEQHARLSEEANRLLQRTLAKNRMSARAYGRIIKVARTIADLEGALDIEPPHIGEAVRYRTLDKAKQAA